MSDKVASYLFVVPFFQRGPKLRVQLDTALILSQRFAATPSARKSTILPEKPSAALPVPVDLHGAATSAPTMMASLKPTTDPGFRGVRNDFVSNSPEDERNLKR
jgi:hypothetical protein